MHQIFSVAPTGEHWSVNSPLAGVVYRFRDRASALDFARRLAQRTPPSTIEIRDADGKVVEEESY